MMGDRVRKGSSEWTPDTSHSWNFISPRWTRGEYCLHQNALTKPKLVSDHVESASTSLCVRCDTRSQTPPSPSLALPSRANRRLEPVIVHRLIKWSIEQRRLRLTEGSRMNFWWLTFDKKHRPGRADGKPSFREMRRQTDGCYTIIVVWFKN